MSVSSEQGAMILQGVFSILLFVALFLMGIDIDLRVVKGVLRKPIGPAIGFFSQFVFMPLASYGIAMGLLKQGDFELLLCSAGFFYSFKNNRLSETLSLLEKSLT